MSVKLLTEQHLEFISLYKEAAQACLSLHMSKCHIAGNHIPRLISLSTGAAILFCGAEPFRHFGRQYYEVHVCEITLNLDQLFRWRFRLKIVLIGPVTLRRIAPTYADV